MLQLTSIYLFRLGDLFCSLKLAINPCSPSYHAMITTRVEAVDDWNIKEDVWPIRHDVINLVLRCSIWRDSCPSSVQSLLEKKLFIILNLCRSALSTSISPLLFLAPVPYDPVHVSVISSGPTLALKSPITILQCALLFMMMLSISSYIFSITSSG